KVYELLATKKLENPEHLNLLAAVYGTRASLLQATQRAPEAEQIFRDSIALWESLDATSKLLPDFREQLGRAQQGLSTSLQDSGRYGEAEVQCRKALDAYDKLVQIF